jgi:hypothetical protein
LTKKKSSRLKPSVPSECQIKDKTKNFTKNCVTIPIKV